MKKIGISLTVCIMLISASAMAQDNRIPYLLKESLRKEAAKLKTGISGSYPQHTVEYNWMTDWVQYRTIETSYFPFGEPSTIEYNKNGDKTRDVFSYNDQHAQTEVVSQAFIGGNWINQFRDVTTYHSNGFPNEMLTEQWNGTDWVVQFGFQITLEMDGNRIRVLTFREWDPVKSEWVNAMRQTYSYPATGDNYSSVIMEMWDNAWVYYSKSDCTWTGNQVTESIDYSHDGTEWVLSGKTTYEYQDNNSYVMTVYLSLGPGQWMAMTRTKYMYDSHGNATLNQTEMYSFMNSSWSISSATSFELTYSGNNLTQRITKQYTTSWNNILKEVFSNFASLSTDVAVLSDQRLNIYPNPAGKQALVRISMLKAGPVTLSIVSMTGQKVLQETFNAGGSDINYQLNLNDLPPGSYILMANDKLGNEIGKTRLIHQ